MWCEGRRACRLCCPVQGMAAMLQSAVQSSPPDLVSQLNYIVEQLNCNTAGGMSASDADDDDDDDDDDGGDDDEEASLCSAVACVCDWCSSASDL